MRISRVPAIALCCALLTLVLWGCAAQAPLTYPQTPASPALEATGSPAHVATVPGRLTPVAPLTMSALVAKTTSEADGPNVTILYTNDGRGKIDPCG